jgi:hypothetical protein
MQACRRSRLPLHACLALACTVAFVAACGSSRGGFGEGNVDASFVDRSVPEGSSVVDASDEKEASEGDAADVGAGFVVEAGPTMHTLNVSPAAATITIASETMPATQTFTALLDNSPLAVPLTWTLDTYAEGTISSMGLYTTKGLVGGTVTVTAAYGSLTASAKLTVNVDVSEVFLQSPVDPGPSVVNQTALQGTPLPDPGTSSIPANPTKFLYPYDQTVMPRGLAAPLLQFSPGTIPPVDVLVRLTGPNFSWKGTGHVANSNVPQVTVPQNVWDGALLASGGQTLTIGLTKAALGRAYGPATTHVVVAPASLIGAVYYQTYDTPNDGLYSVFPGGTQPAKLILPGCLVCHSVSANGARLSVGEGSAVVAAQSGTYRVNGDGTVTQITQGPSGLGGDSRGLSMATWTPDGMYVLRSQMDFWGGPSQLAWKVDPVNKALTPATVIGLGPSVSAYLPAISPDGLHYAFTNGTGDPFGTTGRSISLMDLTVDQATNSLTFSNRQLVVDNGPGGSVTKYVSFLPDGNHIVLEEGESFCAQYGEMCPSYDRTCQPYSFPGSTGRLYLIDAANREQVELGLMNQGNAILDRQRNYEPFALPVTAGGYFWVVFTSLRDYGNTYTGTNVRKQLWVGAVSTNPSPGVDPSHPPFYLPNQSATRNERGFWALQPCATDGSSCQTGDQCCGGFCRPSNVTDPSSPTVCKLPPMGSCSQVGEKCTTTADCCDAPNGVTCIGAVCTGRSQL